MKLLQRRDIEGFSLSETMVSAAIGSVAVATVLASSIALQKTFSAVDRYFSAHNQQVRVVDYLSRDVKRSVIVNTSADKQTVNCTIPNYVVLAGDPDAITGASGNIGTRRQPMVDFNQNAFIVSYGGAKTVSDGVITKNQPKLVSATAAFTTDDVGSRVTGPGIASGSRIQAYTNATTVTMSAPATATASSAKVTIGGARSFSDAATTLGSATLKSTSDAVFTQRDVGLPIAGNGIATGSKIQSVTNKTTATLSQAATASASGVTATIGYSTVTFAVQDQTIVRKENGEITTIASSTDQLVSKTTDVQTANTEYTATAITFKPTFVFGNRGNGNGNGQADDPNDHRRASTSVFSTAYLRNLRRGN